MAVKFANLASTTLASSLSNTATSISVTSSSSFPTLGSGDYFYASIGEGSGSEIVKVTGVSSNTFTVVRGQDGTSAQNWSSGAVIALRVVAAALDDIAEQAQTAADTESVSIDGDTMTGDLSVPSLTFSGSITGGDSTTAALARVHYSDGGYLDVNGWGLEFNRNNSYLRPNNSGARQLEIGGTNKEWKKIFFKTTQGLYMNGAEILTSARALQNITSISSGVITAAGNIKSSGVAHPEFELIPSGSVGNADIRFDGTSLDIRSNSSGAYLTLQTATTERLKITNTGNFEFNGGNFSEVGTISSGAITATGLGINESSRLSPVHVTVTSSQTALTLQNTGGGGGSHVALDFVNYADGSGYANPSARISAVDDGSHGGNVTFYGKASGIAGALSTIMTVKAKGDVEVNSGDLDIKSGDLELNGIARITNAGNATLGGISANSGSTLTLSGNANYGVTLNHGDTGTNVNADALSIRRTSTTGTKKAQIGLITNDTDGLHHRGHIYADRDTVDYGGKIVIRVRSSAGGYDNAIIARYNGDVEFPNGDLKMGSTTFITSGRNLTNIGTINNVNIAQGGSLQLDSGTMINSSRHLQTLVRFTTNDWFRSSDSVPRFYFENNGATYIRAASDWYLQNNSGANVFKFTSTGVVQHNGTQILDASRNLSNIASISSGSISSSGTLTASSYAAVGAIVAADPGSSYYSYNNRIGSGLAVVGTFNNFGDTVISGGLTVGGNLTVNGTTTTINTSNLQVEDKNIVLNYSSGDSSSTADGAGITIQDAVNSTTDASMTWSAADDRFEFSHSIAFDGTPTTTNQNRGIFWSGYDKEGTTDYTDAASIRHTVNAGGHTGSVLLISSQNDANDGIAFVTNASSKLKHNNYQIYTTQDFTNNSGNWNTAYGWGNHASAGYVVGNTSNAVNLTITGVMQANNGYKVGSSTVINSSGNILNIGTITTSGVIAHTGSEGREVQTYLPSSYSAGDLVAGHEYGWYSDHWRVGMTRSGDTPGDDFVIQFNGSRQWDVSKVGNVQMYGRLHMESSHDKKKIGMYGPEGTGAEWIGTSSSTLELSGASINFNGASGTGTPNFKMGGTTVIDSSRNATLGTIYTGGRVGVQTSSPRYDLAVQGNNATAAGIAVDNTSGGGTLDIVALGASYNSHQAGAGEIWFYSPDNINIGGATGNTNDVKFIANNAVNMIVKGNTGNVGIGLSNPSSALDIRGAGSGGSQKNTIAFGTTGWGPPLAPNAALDGGVKLALFEGGTQKVQIGMDGNARLWLASAGSGAQGVDIYTGSSNTAAPTLRFRVDQNGLTNIYNGLSVTGNYTSTGQFALNSDSSQVQLGSGNRGQIFHNGAGLYMRTSTGGVYAQADSFVHYSANAASTYFSSAAGGLSFNSTQFLTSARALTNITGISGTGNWETSGYIRSTSSSDAVGLGLRSTLEVLSGESWCTALYNYNVNDGFLVVRRDAGGNAYPHMHVSGYNNPGYAGYTDGDGMVTITRSTNAKSGGSSTAGTALTSGPDWSRWVKTSTATVFQDADNQHEFKGNIQAGISSSNGNRFNIKVLGYDASVAYDVAMKTHYDSVYGRAGQIATTNAGLELNTEQSNGRIVIKSGSGMVGINNDTPQRKLTVTEGSAGSAGDNSGILSLTVGSGANTDSKLAFGIDSSHQGWIHVVKPGTNVYPLVLNPTNSSNGRVGIGASPTSGYHLDVNGSALVRTNVLIQNRLTVNRSTSSTTEPTATFNSGAGGQPYAFINTYDAYHGIIMRGVPASATTYGVTTGNYMSFVEYGGDFRFYTKSPTALTLDAQILAGVFDGEGVKVNGTLVIDVNKRLLVSDGSASAPYMTFAADTNTGFYRPAADNIGFAVGGVARAFMSGTQFNMTGNGVFSGYVSSGSHVVSTTDLISNQDIQMNRSGTSPAITVYNHSAFRLVTSIGTGTSRTSSVGVNSSGVFYTNTGFAVNSTTVIDSSRNLQNINNAFVQSLLGVNDTNTYINFAGNDQTRFYQGGQERLQINGTGLQLHTGTSIYRSNRTLYNSSGTAANTVQYIKLYDRGSQTSGSADLRFRLHAFNHSEYSVDVKIHIPTYSGFYSSYGTSDAGQGIEVEITCGGLSSQTNVFKEIIEVANMSSTSDNTEIWLKIQPPHATTRIDIAEQVDSTHTLIPSGDGTGWTTTAPSNQQRVFPIQVGKTINHAHIDRTSKITLGGDNTNTTNVLSSVSNPSSSGGVGSGNRLRLQFMEPSYPNYGAQYMDFGVRGGGYVDMRPSGGGLFMYSPYSDNDKIHLGYSGIQLIHSHGGYTQNNDMLLRSTNGIQLQAGGSSNSFRISPSGTLERGSSNTAVLTQAGDFQNVTASAGSAGFKFAANNWFQDSGNRQRFYFEGNGRTFFGSGNGYIFRDSSDVGRATISNSGGINLASGGDGQVGSTVALAVGGTTVLDTSRNLTNVASLSIDHPANVVSSITNSDSGSTHYNTRGNRLLTSNGSNWVHDGKDPMFAFTRSSTATTIGGSIGLTMHNEQNTTNAFSPMIAFSARSTSTSYNSAYAGILGRKIGTAADTNWNAGELWFYAMPQGTYASQYPTMFLDQDGLSINGSSNRNADTRLFIHGHGEYDPCIFLFNNSQSPSEGLEIWYDNSAGDSYITNKFSTGSLKLGTGTGSALKSASNTRFEITGDGHVVLGGSVYSPYISRTEVNTLNAGWGNASDAADMWINYRGYQNGTSYFRDFRIGNGKNVALVFVDGSARTVDFQNNTVIKVGGTTFIDASRSINNIPNIAFQSANGTNAMSLNDGSINFRTANDHYHKMWYFDGLCFGTNEGHGHFRFYAESNTQRNNTTGGKTLVFDIDSQNQTVTASGNITAYSDIKLKDDIQPIENALEKVCAIRGVTFTRKDHQDKTKRHMGVIAQEVEAAGLNEVVEYNEEKDVKTVSYGNMVGVLIEAMKEQQQTIDSLTKRIEELENGNN